MLRIIGKILRGIILIFGVLTLGLIIAAAVGWFFYAPEEKDVADDSVIVISLDMPLPEGRQGLSPIERLFAPEVASLRDVLDVLEAARVDGRIRGLFADLSGTRLPPAQLQELRDAIERFRAADKFAYAYADTYHNGSYYLASAFDKVWLLPTGEFMVTGLAAEIPFARPLLEKIGVEPRFGKREEFKNAFDTFLDSEMSPPYRESLESMLGSIWQQMVEAIAASRGLDAQRFVALAEQAPISARPALEANLVDHLGYFDELLAGTKPAERRIRAVEYLARVDRPYRSGATLAVIYAEGEILRGQRDGSPLSRQVAVEATVMTEAINAADEDEAVRAIVIRMSSPGGSYIASDVIRRAIERARKPVIVSMSSAAASGGYFIAAAADRIIAQPGTITGSIGVVGGKFVLTDLFSEIGVNWEQVSTTGNAGYFSANRDFTPEQWRRFQQRLSEIYGDFVNKVAEGRDMEPAQVAANAKGRVWTGAQAKDRGLVDTLGGFEAALDAARELAKLDENAPLRLVTFPRRKRFGLLGALLDDPLALTQALADLRALGAGYRRLQELANDPSSINDGERVRAATPPIQVR